MKETHILNILREVARNGSASDRTYLTDKVQDIMNLFNPPDAAEPVEEVKKKGFGVADGAVQE